MTLAQTQNDSINLSPQPSLPSQCTQQDMTDQISSFNKLSRRVFVLLGLGILLPWSSLVSAVDFWNWMFPDFHPESSIAVAYMWPTYIGFCVFFLIRNRIRRHIAIYAGFFTFCILFILLPIFLNLSMSIHAKFQCIICFCVLIGISDAFAQGSLYAEAALISNGQGSHAFTVGIGKFSVSPFLTGLIRISTRLATMRGGWSYKTQLISSTAFYLFAPIVVSLSCLIIYYFYRSHSMYDYYFYSQREQQHHQQQHHENSVQTHRHDSGRYQRLSSEDRSDTVHDVHDGIHQQTMSNDDTGPASSSMSSLASCAFVLCLSFCTTLAVFPGLIADMKFSKQTDGAFIEDHADFILILLLVTFSFFDFLGKYYSNVGATWSLKTLWIFALCRVILVPSFILCRGSLFWGRVVVLAVVTAVFGFSGAFLGGAAIIKGPMEASGVEARQAAAYWLTFALLSGLAWGSILGYMLTVIL